MVSVLLIGLVLICVVGVLIAAVALWAANSNNPPQKK
jgi:hypothetical protein